MSDAPVRLSRHHAAAWLLAPALLIAAPVAGLGVGRLIDGPDELEQISGETADWTLPMLFVAAVVALFLVCWVVSVVVLRATERRDVRRVAADPIARWPQYASEDQWTAFVARERGPGRSDTRLAWFAVLAAVAATGGGLLLGGALGSAMAGGAIGGFVAGVILAGSASRVRTSRHDRALDAHRDRLGSVPCCTVSLRGVLDDDLGVTTFTHLARAAHVGPAELPKRGAAITRARRRGEVVAALGPLDRRLAKSGWSFLELTFDQRVTRGVAAGVLRLFEPWYARSAGVRWALFVRVPPSCAGEADAIAELLHAHHRLETADSP